MSNTALRPNIQMGTTVTRASNIDEALQMANLDWGLNVLPAENLTVMTDEGMTETSIPGMRLVTRDDTHLTLGVVGNRYAPLSNSEVFGLGEHLIAQGAQILDAGEVDNGRRVFMNFSIPDSTVTIGKDDVVDFSISVRANHDGRGDVTASLLCKRLICSNGMIATIPSLPHTFSVRHTRNAAARMVEAHQIFQGAVRYAKEFAALAHELLNTPFSRREFSNYIAAIYPAPGKDEGRTRTIWENRHAALMEMFSTAPTNEAGRGTAWNAYNSLTEYVDWVAPVRGEGNEVDIRTRRQFDGAGQSIKDRGFALLNA